MCFMATFCRKHFNGPGRLAVTQLGSCVEERRTAGRSASLGMTKGRAALTLAAVTEGWTDPQLLGSRRPTSDSFSH
jgi:hypothetical protein